MVAFWIRTDGTRTLLAFALVYLATGIPLHSVLVLECNRRGLSLQYFVTELCPILQPRTRPRVQVSRLMCFEPGVALRGKSGGGHGD